ncbi:GntR family transcriptional regulator [Acuticoccus sp. I52.16.1]|uniref:GntR family transcriptional regulator n=1 Tax=Acuticoccus sp. I52.16.1 TaxID=2928472 RepID=UPI001FD48CB4|nr:GntR family transcriptional regulator [Acuticoccus sp. I52.16.1]UOM35684.1 GntR family transcriptional regulator [Acuticoccus sp. I52.16.1]
MSETDPRATAATRSEQAYVALKRRVLDNEFPVGSFFLEQELADLLEMSRTPIREALVRLANEGFVEIRPRHGMRVLPISATDMREIYTILTALEAEVAAEVATRGLTGDELAALRQAVDDMEAALTDDDRKAWAVADERFHRCLVGASANQRLRAVILQFWEQAHRVRMLTLRLRPKPVKSTQEHHELVDALEAREPERARQIHRVHRETAANMLAEILSSNGLTNL